MANRKTSRSAGNKKGVGKPKPDARRRVALSEPEILNLARYFGRQAFDAEGLRRTVAAHRLVDTDHGGRWTCATPLFALFRASLAATTPAVRHQVKGFYPAGLGQSQSALTSAYHTPHFNITWDTTVPMRDLQRPAGPLVLGGRDFGALVDSEIPKYVQAISLVLETAWQSYVVEFGFRDPCAKHPGEIEIGDTRSGDNDTTAGYGGYSDDTESAYIKVYYNLEDNDVAQVPLHELFHCVQDRYHRVSGMTAGDPAEPEDRFWSEGSADIAPDFVADSLNTWMGRFGGVFLHGHPRPALGELAYAAAGVWRYMLEQCAYPATDGQPLAVALRQCWEYAVGRPALNVRLFADAFDRLAPRGTRFAEIQRTVPNGLDVLCSDTLIGDFMLAATERANADPRLTFAEDQEPPVVKALRQDGNYPVTAQTPVAVATDVRPWEFRFYCFLVKATAGMVRYTIQADAPAAAHIVLINDGDLNVVRTDRVNFSRALAAEDASGVVRLGLVSLAAETCRFTISAEVIPPVPDLIIARINCIHGFDSENNPAQRPWLGLSPDIYLDAPGKLEFDVVEKGNVTPVSVYVGNKGLADAQATVRLFYQVVSAGGICDTEWKPMRDKAPGDPAGQDQTISLAVPKRGLGIARATWYIAEDARPVKETGKGKGPHSKYGHQVFKGVNRYAIRAVVECPEDGSPDNNSAIQYVSIAARHERYVPYPAQPAKGKKHPKERKPKRPKPKKPKRAKSEKRR